MAEPHSQRHCGGKTGQQRRTRSVAHVCTRQTAQNDGTHMCVSLFSRLSHVVFAGCLSAWWRMSGPQRHVSSRYTLSVKLMVSFVCFDEFACFVCFVCFVLFCFLFCFVCFDDCFCLKF